MTEDEAKTKWCPFARNFIRDQDDYFGAANRDGNGPLAISSCVGSACMAWRWTNEVTGRGYCGLAGSHGL